MGLVWIIFADPELVLGQGRLQRAGEIRFCSVWVYCLGLGHSDGYLGDGHRISGKEIQKALHRGGSSPWISPSHLHGQETQVKLARTGSSSSMTSETGRRGAGEDLRLPLSPLQQQKALRQMRGRQKPLAVLHPLPENPHRSPLLPWAVPAPRASKQPPPPAGLESPRSPVNLIHTPPASPKVTRVQGSPRPGRAKLPNSSPAPAPPPAPPTQSWWESASCKAPAPTPNPTRHHTTAPRARE